MKGLEFSYKVLISIQEIVRLNLKNKNKLVGYIE